MDINARNVRENRQILQFSGYSYQDLKNDLHIYSRILRKLYKSPLLHVQSTVGKFFRHESESPMPDTKF